jgi:hypothetical protein
MNAIRWFFLLFAGSFGTLMAQPAYQIDAQQVLNTYQGFSFCETPTNAVAFERFANSLAKIEAPRVRFEQVRRDLCSQCLLTPQIYELMQIFQDPSMQYDLMRLLYYYSYDPENFMQLLPFMAGDIYRQRFNTFLNERIYPVREEVESRRQLLDPTEMKQALQVITDLSTADAQLMVGKFIISHNNLRSDQWARVVDLMTLGRDRVELAEYGYDFIYDPGKYYAVYENLRQRDARQVTNYIGAAQRSEEEAYVNTRRIGCTSRVLEQDFRAQLATLRAQRLSGDKLRFAKNFINSYCLTVVEFKEVIKELNNQRDQLELARIGYERVFDPWNYHLLAPTFATTTNILELYGPLLEAR